MKKLVLAAAISTSLLSFSAIAENKVSSSESFFSNSGTVVTADSYPTVETSRQLLKNQDLVGVNKLLHKRQLTPTDNQPVVRMNRDTYYSFAVVDVSKGASITMPEIPKGKYWEKATFIMLPFVGDFLNEQELLRLTKRAYSHFPTDEAAPLRKLKNKTKNIKEIINTLKKNYFYLKKL